MTHSASAHSMTGYQRLFENIRTWERNAAMTRGSLAASELDLHGAEVLFLLHSRTTEASKALAAELRSICQDAGLPQVLRRRAIEFAEAPCYGGMQFEMAEELEYRVLTLMSRKIPAARSC